MERILSRASLRCQQTVQPLARDRFLEVEPLAALGVDASLSDLLGVFWNRALRNAALCTHGETIGQFLTQLVADGSSWTTRWTGQGLDLAAPAH